MAKNIEKFTSMEEIIDFISEPKITSIQILKVLDEMEAEREYEDFDDFNDEESYHDLLDAIIEKTHDKDVLVKAIRLASFCGGYINWADTWRALFEDQELAKEIIEEVYEAFSNDDLDCIYDPSGLCSVWELYIHPNTSRRIMNELEGDYNSECSEEEFKKFIKKEKLDEEDLISAFRIWSCEEFALVLCKSKLATEELMDEIVDSWMFGDSFIEEIALAVCKSRKLSMKTMRKIFEYIEADYGISDDEEDNEETDDDSSEKEMLAYIFSCYTGMRIGVCKRYSYSKLFKEVRSIVRGVSESAEEDDFDDGMARDWGYESADQFWECNGI